MIFPSKSKTHLIDYDWIISFRIEILTFFISDFLGVWIVETLLILFLESTFTDRSKSIEVRCTSMVASMFLKSSLIVKDRNKTFPPLEPISPAENMKQRMLRNFRKREECARQCKLEPTSSGLHHVSTITLVSG